MNNKLLSHLILLLCIAWLTPVMAALPDYSAYDDLLLNYVNNGFVDYDGIAADGRLDDFIRQLGETRPEDLTDPDTEKAFYINAYNAIAIRGILNGYSASNAWNRYRFFKGMKVSVLGHKTSLNDIEHERLRPMGDPRIHFAIVCASLSCPRLSSHAYRPEQLDAQLDSAARLFINDPTRNRFDHKRRKAFLSAIFDWFGDDFSAKSGSVQRYLAAWVQDPDAERLLKTDSFDVSFNEYDWGLNGLHQHSGD
ncbi:MAG TPA: DUF547 domain-containing protein [Chromatiales bacterium]|nr:DUF547 domain-containing protein [Chromatiales bacterium]